jgi:hypothetical protein
MSITIHPALETELPAKAEAEGLSVEAYLERLIRAGDAARDHIEALAAEGLRSGDPIEAGPGYWEDRHRRLQERTSRSSNL